jgi:transcriptional regulator with XRE-family HTH domain
VKEVRNISKFDKEKFAFLLNKARGNRSINQYALHSGVTAAHISRLSRGLLDSPPTPQTIKKLAEHAHNNVTYEELMAAAGYLQETATNKDGKIDDPSPPPAKTEKSLQQRRIELEQAFKELLRSETVMFDGMPIGELDEEIIEDLELMLDHILEFLKKKKQKAASGRSEDGKN